MHFPGYTHAVIYQMPFADWVLLAHASDELDEQYRKNAQKSRTNRRR